MDCCKVLLPVSIDANTRGWQSKLNAEEKQLKKSCSLLVSPFFERPASTSTRMGRVMGGAKVYIARQHATCGSLKK